MQCRSNVFAIREWVFFRCYCCFCCYYSFFPQCYKCDKIIYRYFSVFLFFHVCNVDVQHISLYRAIGFVATHSAYEWYYRTSNKVLCLSSALHRFKASWEFVERWIFTPCRRLLRLAAPICIVGWFICLSDAKKDLQARRDYSPQKLLTPVSNRLWIEKGPAVYSKCAYSNALNSDTLFLFWLSQYGWQRAPEVRTRRCRINWPGRWLKVHQWILCRGMARVGNGGQDGAQQHGDTESDLKTQWVGLLLAHQKVSIIYTIAKFTRCLNGRHADYL